MAAGSAVEAIFDIGINGVGGKLQVIRGSNWSFVRMERRFLRVKL